MTPSPTTRASLLLRLRDHQDHDAWGEFVSIYEPVIYRSLRRNGLQDGDALEVLQELFLAVSRNIHRWKPGAEYGSFRGWLRRVTRNLVVSWVRRNNRQVTTAAVDLESLFESPPAIGEPETEIFDREVRRAIFHQASDRVRAEVQPQTWQAFWAVAVAGESIGGTADKLRMSVGAVRVAKCRIIARLREVVLELERSP